MISEREAFHYNRKFDEEYAYYGDDLGASCGEEKTGFKLWAPFAEKVELCLYRDGGSAMELTAEDSLAQADKRLPMAPAGQGIWELALDGNLHGTYYDYLLYGDGKILRTADPCAKACCCNGQRSMAVDLSKTDPDGFAEDRAPEKPAEDIIYELHIRDFSQDPESGVPEEYRGRYKAFTVSAEGGESVKGVEYLQKLGVTYVHLLPFYDFGWLDERDPGEQFNWGYDPVNYNVPEGSFATDCTDGSVRIRECKEMIQALHRAGIRVVMDVVYNHTYEADSWLERTAPGYFDRREADGRLSNGSACGNDLAAGRAMVDNYIVHSVLYWAEEYHLDGFRFDLMGLLTTELMNRIREELDERYGTGEKLLYGEPWRAGESPMERGTHAALKENIALLDKNVAVFCDDTRDLIKGDVFHKRMPGFVNGAEDLEERILDAVSGWCNNVDGFRPRACSQIVNYVSAHDNYTLWDKLLLSMKPERSLTEADYLTPFADVLAANRLAALMYFTCQGHLFLQAGEEFGRTKFGDDNSYRSAPGINMLRWGQTKVFESLVEYYRGLISLRKQLPGLCDKRMSAAVRISGRTVHRARTMSFFVDNREKGTDVRWESLYIIYNAADSGFEVTLPEGKSWEILADGQEADCRKSVGRKVRVPAVSGMILGQCRQVCPGNGQGRTL